MVRSGTFWDPGVLVWKSRALALSSEVPSGSKSRVRFLVSEIAVVGRLSHLTLVCLSANVFISEGPASAHGNKQSP